MGWKYRRSINLGGGFRINLSKSGIGYSWGFPGYRHTYSPNGSQRKTYSIPGTGISYVETNKTKNGNNSNYNYDYNTKLITGATTYYQNINISNMGKDDEILNSINRLRNTNIIANICLLMIILFPIGILLKLLIYKKWKIDLTYEMDDVNKKRFDALNVFLNEIKNNKKIWQVASSTRVYNIKYNAGADNNVSRNGAFLVKKMPWYINHNIDVFCLKLKNEKIFFTPDRMLIFKKFGRVGSKSYDSLVADFCKISFVETGVVPSDAEIISYTWKYVNKNGGPDKRFSDNKKLLVCKYGEMSLKTNDGINILLEFSNHRLMYSIQDKFVKFVDFHKQISFTKNYIKEYSIFESNDKKENINNSNFNKDKWNNFNDSSNEIR